MTSIASTGRACTKCGKELHSAPKHATCWSCRNPDSDNSQKARARLWEKMREVPEEAPRAKLSAPPLPGSHDGLFGCRAKEQDLPAATCLELQAGDPEDEGNRDRFCASGECLQGAKVKLALERLGRVRRCSKCRRVELGESNTDGLCSKCRPPEPARPWAERSSGFSASFEVKKQEVPVIRGPGPVSVALVRSGPPPASRLIASGGTPAPTPTRRPPPAPERRPMAETCNDPEGCTAPAKSRGKCGKHYQRWLKAGKPGDDSAPAKPRARSTPPQQVSRPAGGELPDLGAVPASYLLAAVRELRRRHKELTEGLTEAGISQD